MSEELKIVWVGEERGGGAGPGPQSKSTGATAIAEMKGPKDDGKLTSAGALFTTAAESLGFGLLAKQTTSLIGGFKDLNGDISNLFSGKAAGAVTSSSLVNPFRAADSGGKLKSEVTGPPVKTAIDGKPSSAIAEMLEAVQSKINATKPDKALSLGKYIGQGAKFERTAERVAGPVASTASTAGAESEIIGPAAAKAATSLGGVAAVAVPLTAALSAITAASYAVKLGMTQLYSDMDNLAGYSGPLSQANSEGQIRQEMSEMRRAERLGPQLADLADITSRGSEQIYTIQTELLKALLDGIQELRPLAEAAITSGKLAAAVIPSMKENLDVLVRAAVLDIPGAIKQAEEAVDAAALAGEKIAKILLEEEEKPPIDDPQIKLFFQGRDAMFNPPPAPAIPPGFPLGGFMS